MPKRPRKPNPLKNKGSGTLDVSLLRKHLILPDDTRSEHEKKKWRKIMGHE